VGTFQQNIALGKGFYDRPRSKQAAAGYLAIFQQTRVLGFIDAHGDGRLTRRMYLFVDLQFKGVQ
jgi:hypothetical protein